MSNQLAMEAAREHVRDLLPDGMTQRHDDLRDVARTSFMAGYQRAVQDLKQQQAHAIAGTDHERRSRDRDVNDGGDDPDNGRPTLDPFGGRER